MKQKSGFHTDEILITKKFCYDKTFAKKRMMRIFWQHIVLLLILSATVSAQSQTAAVDNTPALTTLHSPAGCWQTFDSGSNKPRSMIQIFMQPSNQSEQSSLSGKIIGLYSVDGKLSEKLAEKVCSQCSGDPKPKLIGLKILWGLKQNNNKWTGGHVFDPKTGKTYRCQISLSNNGKNLNLRASVGFFSKTKTWKRTVCPSAQTST